DWLRHGPALRDDDPRRRQGHRDRSLPPTSIEATKRRLALKGLSADVVQGDAEALPFPDKSFDIVWSWGVIHHSSRTAKIVRGDRPRAPAEGECRVMVYHRGGARVAVTFVREYLLGGRFLQKSFDETLYETTDGFSARFYVPEQFEDLFRAFFKDVSSEICGQESDAIPLPRRLRRFAIKMVSESDICARRRRGAGASSSSPRRGLFSSPLIFCCAPRRVGWAPSKYQCIPWSPSLGFSSPRPAGEAGTTSRGRARPRRNNPLCGSNSTESTCTHPC
ncbi:MAG: methyltransferase domain-containing protein, partial [Anaeromyxobacteraceae bacterium]